MSELWDLMANALVAEPTFGAVTGRNIIAIHGRDRCAGSPCPFHNPSDHPLRYRPIIVRLDKMALVERLCEHGIGHDDPDSVAWLHSRGQVWAGIHGCDGCCRG